MNAWRSKVKVPRAGSLLRSPRMTVIGAPFYVVERIRGIILRKDLPPGGKVIVTMSSDARYTLDGEPETAFAHPTFRSVDVKFFLKVGSSPWVEFGSAPVENVIGSKDAREVINNPTPG